MLIIGFYLFVISGITEIRNDEDIEYKLIFIFNVS